jgi:polar amino acid transport system substrate-binding protein
MLKDEQSIGLFSLKRDFTISSWSSGCENLFGFNSNDIVGQSIFSTILPEHLKDSFKSDLKRKKHIEFEQLEFISVAKTREFLLTTVRYIGDETLFLVLDFNQKSSKNIIKNLIDMHSDMKDVVISLDKNGYIKEFNIHATSLTGYRKDEVYERNFIELFIPTTYQESILHQIQDSFRKKSLRVIDNFPMVCKDGSKKIVYWNYELLNQSHRDKRLFLTSYNHNIETISRQKLDYLASYDLLTDLPNKNLFMQRIVESINRVSTTHKRLILLYMDIKNFSFVNHALGISSGDIVLQMVAKRLNNRLRDYDLLARFDGDEFVMIFDDIDSDLDSIKIITRVMDSFREDFEVNGSSLKLEVSVGVSSYPSDANDSKTLLKNANLALKQAQKSSKSDYRVFNPSIYEEVSRQVLLKNNMRKALENGEFFVVYQPLVDVVSSKIVGAEALIRWETSELKSIPPLDFIPVAEDNGFILEIGELVLGEAIKSAKKIHSSGNIDFKVSVNISAIQFLQSDLIKSIKSLLEKYEFNANCLQLEITENIFMENLELAAAILNEFKEMGIKIAIDDFGTGYSSLSYLSKLPVDVIKIDQSFIQNLSNNTDPIIDAIISMSHALNLEVIAEGVENSVQLGYLKQRDCDIMQGYYYSKAIKLENLESLLSSSYIVGKDYIDSYFTNTKEELKELSYNL